MLDELLKLIQNESAVNDFCNRKKRIRASSILEEAFVLAAAYSKSPRNIIVIKNSLYMAQQLYERLHLLLPTVKVLLYPSDESLRIEAFATSKELLTQRVYVLSETMTEEKKIIIAHVSSLVRPLPTYQSFINGITELREKDQISPNILINKLSANGYERTTKIEHSLQYAMRGAVVDIFSLNYDDPIRIEFFGNEIDDIRFFDLHTQRTIKRVPSVKILPASDLVVSDEVLASKVKELLSLKEKKLLQLPWDYREVSDIYLTRELESLSMRTSYATLLKYYHYISDGKISSLLDYCQDYLCVVSDLEAVKAGYELLSQETWNYLEELIDMKKDLIKYHLYDDLNYVLDKKSYIQFESFFEGMGEELHVRTLNECKGNGQLLKALVKQGLDDHNKIIFCLDNPVQKDYLVNLLDDVELLPFANSLTQCNSPSYLLQNFKEGFELVDFKLMFITPYEIFGKGNISKIEYSKYKNAQILKSWENLKKGDYIVHETYGIGQYLEIKTMEMDGIHRDYLHIQYRDEQKLYVPLEKFQLVRKYVSREGAAPKLSKLGSSEWSKTKQRIKNKINDIADRLIELYKNRNMTPGYSFKVDEEFESMFSSAFAYQLTKDQMQGYKDIRYDMQQPYPMDRLLCGDVGFGKTEVAFRAAYLAILNGKQVSLLCPTTILSRQHYLTAMERFQNFDIRIGLLNRFVSHKETQMILKRLKDGELDLIIGTHRLLSKDIIYKDLGLLIVDEEQRFGVEHKEKIKEIKINIDVLTLSATPIPRTLQMSLLGIRNLSQINTPPNARMPIQTYVLEYNERLIKELVERELGRNGQVFFLHNNIMSLPSFVRKIQSLVFNARIGIAHGKLDREDIEETMNRFYDHEIDILICTTIIENGIDIPNANTIIINNADCFGLAQLYQIKGRVGRGDRLGYAYLFYNANKEMTEDAQKRLKTIKEFAELGSGYKIAMRDLSIRGAGDILGSEQAGFVDSLGMDMYIKILQETIEERRDGVVYESESTSQPLHVDAYIPQQFESNDNEKIELYKQMDKIKNLEALSAHARELDDIYGKIPQNVELLLKKRELDLLVDICHVDKVEDSKDKIELSFSHRLNDIDGVGMKLFELLNQYLPKDKLFFNNKKIRLVIFKRNQEWLYILNEFLLSFYKFIENEKNID